jgi:sulfite reductase (ferredoxin)
MQVVIGGGLVLTSVQGFVADKVIKLPSRRIPEALRTLLSDYQDNKQEDENYLKYSQRQGKIYFYNLLKPIADTDQINEIEFFDWGQDSQYIQSIGVGECAGVSYDMVGAILGDAIEKLDEAKASFKEETWSESIYHAYTAMVIAAKGWLLAKDVKCNTHIGIIEDFETHFANDPEFVLEQPFSEMVLQMRETAPEQKFSEEYLNTASTFVGQIIKSRKAEGEFAEKMVLDSYYKA